MRNFSGLSLMLSPQLTSKAKTENPHPWHLLSSTDSLKCRFVEREFENNNNKKTVMISPTGSTWRRWLYGFWVLQFFLKIGTRAFAAVYFFGGICDTHGGQRTTCWSWFFPPTACIPGTDWADVPLQAEPCHQPWIFVLYRIRLHTG